MQKIYFKKSMYQNIHGYLVGYIMIYNSFYKITILFHDNPVTYL